MKPIKTTNEKGQILMLLAVAIVALLAFVALAIDGGMILFDRRRAQNAADAAALAGGYQIARNPSSLAADVISTAEGRAADNFFSPAYGKTVVVTYPYDPARPVNGDEDTEHYVHVVINSPVSTSFLHLFYKGVVVNTVEAVAHVIPPKRDNMFPGSAMVALSPHGCAVSNGSGGGIYLGGNGWTNLVGGGMFVNSDSDCSVNGPGGSWFAYTPTLVDVGKVSSTITSTQFVVNPGPKQENATDQKLSYPTRDYLDPPTCTGTAMLYGPGSYTRTAYDETTRTYKYYMTPGNSSSVLPNDDVWLEPGKYCFSNPTNKSILSLNNTQQLGGTGVLIYITGYDPCNFKWNGGNTIKLKAITDLTDVYKGLLLYVDPKTWSPASTGVGEGPMTFNGTAASFINGTIYAPTCTAVLNGTNGNMYQGQVVAFNIILSGNNSFNMNYNPDDNVEVQSKSKIDLAQ